MFTFHSIHREVVKDDGVKEYTQRVSDCDEFRIGRSHYWWHEADFFYIFPPTHAGLSPLS
jgi:hypothetical protein